jgi:hypothetical protein
VRPAANRPGDLAVRHARTQRILLCDVQAAELADDERLSLA